MKIKIPVQSKKDFYEKYLLFLNPLLSLKQDERKVLASYISYYDLYYNKDYNPSTFHSILFSDTINNSIKNKLSLTDKRYKSIMKVLKNKTLIQENKINSKVLYPVFKKDYNLEIQFINDKKEY